jgi:hypothetical protein
MTPAPDCRRRPSADERTWQMTARGGLRTSASVGTVELSGERALKVFWYLCSGLMVANGLFMALGLHRYAEGIMFVAIGVGFVVLRHYRLRRDRNRTFE